MLGQASSVRLAKGLDGGQKTKKRLAMVGSLKGEKKRDKWGGWE